MKKIKQLMRNKFIKNVFILASGTAGAQAIIMLLSPIITRLYGPEAFGIMGAFNAMINMIIPVAAMTYPIAIVLPKKNEEAKNIIKLSLLISTLLSILSLLVIVPFKDYLVSLFRLTEISPYIIFVPIVIIFAGLMQIMEQWLIRTKQFSINARVTIFESLITNLGKVGVGFFYPHAIVLIVFTAFSNGIKGLLMFFLNKNSIFITKHEKIQDVKNIKKLSKKFYDFPLYRAPEQFLNAASNGLPVLMLTAFFGPASAGFYSIGRTVLRLPTQLIGKSVGDVFYPRIAEAYNNKENIVNLIKRATLALAGVGIIPYGIIILFGPQLFSLVFGNDWVIAGEYARWLALWSFFGFINRPSVRSLAVLSAQKFHLLYTIGMLITRIIVLITGYYIFSSDTIAVALFGVSGAILNIGLIIFTLKISKSRMNGE